MTRISTRSYSFRTAEFLRQQGVHPVLARLYAARGLEDARELSSELASLVAPSGLLHVDAAAVFLADAINAGKKLVIVADYDCDGATACAVALRGLRSMGANIDFIVPNRFEYGYGLTPEIVELTVREKSPDVIVTVDNGIASLEAITVCVGAALCCWLAGVGSAAWLPLLLAAATAGFLAWNYPPARIFMGDAGSGFLGIVLGGLSLQAAWQAPQLFWSWLILLGAFVVDATWTLARRLLRGERVHEAHRSHAYQRASRRLGQHRAISLSVAAINLIWLSPIAVFVALGWIDGVAGLILAYAPLVLVVAVLGAGGPENGQPK